MSDEKKSELTDSQRKYGKWTDEQHEAYVAARNEAAANKIFALRNGMINSVTGKPRRETRVEQFKGPHSWIKQGYDPHSAWRSKRNYGDE
jgi:hypothetical protein